jgi:hypothetical protein
VRNFFIGLLINSIGSVAIAQEGGIKIPMSLESSAVLPSGVRNINYRNAFFQGVNKFERNNQIVPVGNALNKEVTWNKLLESKDDTTERATIKGLLDKAGVNLDDPVGDTTGIVELNIDVQVPIMAYGVNENWTMAIAVPIVTSELYVDSGFIAKENLEDFANNELSERSVHKAYELQTKTLDAINEKLKNNNYNRLPTGRVKNTRVGDIVLVSKYMMSRSDKLSVALKNSLTLPTGETTDVNEAVDIGTGDGQWDLGAGVAIDYNMVDWLKISLFNGVEVQLPDSRAKRIPEKGDSKISPDIDRKTEMDLGDKWSSQLGLTFSFWNGFSFLNAYTFQYKEPDRYDGSAFAGYRYNYLERDTEQRMETAQLGLGYSTIPLFQQKRFAVPLAGKLLYTKVIGGKNVIKTEMTTLEFSLFF